MDENEKKHEIEWLMGSIKRDYARMKTKFIVNIILIIVFVLLVGFGHYTNAPEAKDMVDISIIDGPKWAVIAIWTLIGVFILFQASMEYDHIVVTKGNEKAFVPIRACEAGRRIEKYDQLN